MARARQNKRMLKDTILKVFYEANKPLRLVETKDAVLATGFITTNTMQFANTIRVQLYRLDDDAMVNFHDDGTFSLTEEGRKRANLMWLEDAVQPFFKKAWLTPEICALAKGTEPGSSGILGDALEEAGATAEIRAICDDAVKSKWLMAWIADESEKILKAKEKVKAQAKERAKKKKLLKAKETKVTIEDRGVIVELKDINDRSKIEHLVARGDTSTYHPKPGVTMSQIMQALES